jgi:homoserine kinase
VTIKQVRVYSPGSIANLGPGFDVFGIAIEGLGDVVLLKEKSDPGIEISMQGVGAENIPTEPEKNSSGAIIKHVIDKYGIEHGFNVEINKGVPPGKGMGSSGSSASATAFGLNEMLGLTLSKEQIIELAALGEGAVAGAPHADNVSASILGGFIMISDNWEFIRMDAPKMSIVVAAPDIHIENKTRVARELLPENIPLKNAIKNIKYASRMAVAVAKKDPVLFGRNICDYLIEPYRAAMIPSFWDVKQAALDTGAYGCSIAGGGPSLFAVGDNIYKIGEAMKAAFKETRCQLYFTQPSNLGARVI